MDSTPKSQCRTNEKKVQLGAVLQGVDQDREGEIVDRAQEIGDLESKYKHFLSRFFLKLKFLAETRDQDLTIAIETDQENADAPDPEVDAIHEAGAKTFALDTRYLKLPRLFTV